MALFRYYVFTGFLVLVTIPGIIGESAKDRKQAAYNRRQQAKAQRQDQDRGSKTLLLGELSTPTESDVEDMPMRVFRTLSTDDLSTMGRTLPTNVIDAICERVLSQADTATIKKILISGIHCYTAGLAGDPNIRLKGGRASFMLGLLKEGEPTSTWDKTKWKEAMRMKDGLASDDISSMDATALRGLVTDGTFVTEKVRRKDQVRAMKKAIQNAYGRPDEWDSSTIGELADGGLMDTLTVDTLKKMNASTLRTQRAKFKNTVFSDRSKKRALGQKLLQGLGGRSQASSFATQDVKDASQFLLTRPTYLDQVSDDVLVSAVADLNSFVKSRSEAAGLAKRLKRLSRLSNPNTLTATDIQHMGKALPAMGRNLLSRLDPAQIHGAISDLKDAQFKPEEANVLIEKMIDNGNINPSTMSSSDVINLGNLMEGMRANRLREIPQGSLADATDLTSKIKLKPAQGRVFFDSMTNGNQAFGTYAKNLMRFVRKSELMNVTFDGMQLECLENAEPLRLGVTKAQAYTIIDKAVEEMGEPEPDNPLFTKNCAIRWGRIMAIGFNKQRIRLLAADAEISNIAEVMAQYQDVMEEPELKEWAAKVDEALLEDMNLIDDALVNQVGSFFKYFSDDKLNQVPRILRHEVCRKIGESSLRRLPRAEIRRLFVFCIKHVNRNGTPVDLTDETVLEDDDVSFLGGLRCGMANTDVVRLSEDALINNLPEMSNCTFDSETGIQLMNTAYNRIDDFLVTSDNLVMAAGQLHHLDSAKLQEIDQNALADSFIDIAETVNQRQIYEQERIEAFPDEEDAIVTDKTTDLLREGLVAIKATELTSRKKRSITITCSDIMAMGIAASILTADDISSLSSTDFNDCAETLGSISNWNRDVLETMAQKAKQTWDSDVSAWNISQITTAGSIVAGLSASEISSLDLSDDDAVYSISQHNLYSSGQLAAAFTSWLGSNAGTPGSIVASDFLTLNNFLCGATPGIIAGITSTEYAESSDAVGQLRCFVPDQLTSLDVHVRATFGNDVSSWTPSTVTNIGTLLGGITSQEMATLSNYQVAAILSTTISTIPPNVLAGLTMDQIRGLTISQARSITLAQQLQFSDDQMGALEEAGGTNLRADTSEGGINYVAVIVGSVAAVSIVAGGAITAVINRRRIAQEINKRRNRRHLGQEEQPNVDNNEDNATGVMLEEVK